MNSRKNALLALMVAIGCASGAALAQTPTPDQQAAVKDKLRSMTPEQKAEAKAKWDAMTPEEQAAAKKRFAEKHPRAAKRMADRQQGAASASK